MPPVEKKLFYLRCDLATGLYMEAEVFASSPDEAVQLANKAAKDTDWEQADFLPSSDVPVLRAKVHLRAWSFSKNHVKDPAKVAE